MSDAAIFWLPNERIGGRPGPNQVAWDLRAIQGSGVFFVLSLTERMVGKSEAFFMAGLDHACVPLPKSAPPRPGDARDIFHLLPLVAELIERQLAMNSGRILLHCSSGKDRSGLVLVYFLIRKRHLGIEESMRQVRAVQPRLLTAEGWYDMAVDVLAQLGSSGP